MFLFLIPGAWVSIMDVYSKDLSRSCWLLRNPHTGRQGIAAGADILTEQIGLAAEVGICNARECL